jgi:multiple sugar transport system substrate-binding protein
MHQALDRTRSVGHQCLYPGSIGIYNTGGKQWGLPFLTTGSYLFYNMDVFDAAGIAYPTTDWDDETWTWSAALDLAKKLSSNVEDPATALYGWNEAIWPAEAVTWLFGANPWPADSFETGFAQSVNFTSEGRNCSLPGSPRPDVQRKVMPDAAASRHLIVWAVLSRAVRRNEHHRRLGMVGL